VEVEGVAVAEEPRGVAAAAAEVAEAEAAEVVAVAAAEAEAEVEAAEVVQLVVSVVPAAVGSDRASSSS
jgi:hypothetical protein